MRSTDQFSATIPGEHEDRKCKRKPQIDLTWDATRRKQNMWSKDSQLYILAWVGAISGVFGVGVSILAIIRPEGFPISAGRLALIAVLALAICALTITSWRGIGRAISRPDIETLFISKVLTIHENGVDATLVRTQIDRANRNIRNHTLTVGSFASNGDLQEMIIDGEPIKDSEKEWAVHSLRVSRTRQEPLRAGQSITRVLVAHLHDAFPKRKETFTHSTGHEAKKLSLEIDFPENKRPHIISAYLAFADQPHAKLPEPQMSNGRRTAKLEIERPQLGGEYKIEWEW